MVRIDANVEDTALQVEGGHAEILKYFQVKIIWSNYIEQNNHDFTLSVDPP